jgi:hypothetical protein
MKPFLRILFFIALFGIGAKAQDGFDGRSFGGIKKDYKLVNPVAHVKIKNIQFAAPDLYPLYIVESEIVESFKGKTKKGQSFVFYFHAEEGFDVKPLIGDKWIVFLQGKYSTPDGGNGCYELENSKLSASLKLITRIRRLKFLERKANPTRL